MDVTRARELLSALADGIDPFTGELFPREHICNHPDIIRALHQILGPSREAKKDSSTPNAGKPWLPEEKEKLVNEFQSGMSLSEIAKNHGRSRGSIEARLSHLGLLEESYHTRK